MPAGQTLQIGGLGSSGGGGGGTGTVTDVSVVTANGISGSVANSTTTPAITLTHGAITPTSVNGLTISTTTGILTLANGSTLVTSGANSITLTTTGATNVTFPLSGTLATLTGSETFTNKTFASGSGTSIDGSLILAGTVNYARLGSGGGGATKFLREDNTWQAIGGGGDALVANPLSQFAATTSAQLAGVISDETGSGALVFGTSPTLTTPTIGVATATSVNKVTITAPATSATLTIADGASLITSGANSLTLTTTGTTNVTLPTSGTLITNVMTTGGDIIYGGASGVQTRLANGTAGQVLQSNGTTLAPSWVTPSGGGDMVLASVQSVTGAKTFDSNKFILAGSTSGTTILNANATAGAGTVTLPTTGTLATLAQTETFSNKTLTTPKIAQINGTGNNLAVATFTDTSSAVNYLGFASAATGSSPSILASGSDTNIGLTLSTKATGAMSLQATSGSITVDSKTQAFTSSNANGTIAFAFTGTNSGFTSSFGSSATATVVTKQSHTVTSTGTTAAGFGQSTDYTLQASTGSNYTAVSFQQIWADASANAIGNAKFVLLNVAAGNSTVTFLGSGGISMVKTGGSAVTIIPHASTGAWTLTLPSGAGSNGQVLTTDGSGGTSWTTAGGMTNPMTTGGDVIYGGASGTPTRLANGSSGQVLTSAGGTSAPTWTTPAGLTGFTATLETASPNNTVNASYLLASGGSTDQDAVISPKGNGAFQLALADGTTTGGNKRGTGAVDLQLGRPYNNKVASGSYSCTIGYGCEASQPYSFAAGQRSAATGDSSVSIGEWCSSVGASSFSAVSNSAAIGNYSVAIGYSCVATGVSSVALGNSSATDAYATSFGISNASKYGQVSWGSTVDTNQTSNFSISNTTTNATQTDLFCDGTAATKRMTIPNNTLWTFSMLISGRRSDASDGAGYKVEGVIENRGGTTALIGTITKTVLAESDATWDVDVVADDTNDALVVNVTGAAGKTIHWYGAVKVAEVS